MHCHRCGSGRVETDSSSGTTYCVGCGEVLEENTIVSEVAFQELSGGKTILQGSFAGESGRISGGGMYGRRGGKEGQEQAMDNGRQKIARLAYALQLPERYREAAQRYYNLAVINRFTKGRKSDHVAAVCLYIVCRNEQSSQMLIDFSDLLQINVFNLGGTFLKLVRVLCLKLPLVDPSIYISRFAAALDFGEYTQRVAHDAVRLVQRMDRDWIRTGRRPAGICGASLLIAARINGFRRTTREMLYIVKVADVTIQKRLKEFGETESAKLSVRDFRTMWLETEADPPAFVKNKKKQKESGDDESSEEETATEIETSTKELNALSKENGESVQDQLDKDRSQSTPILSRRGSSESSKETARAPCSAADLQEHPSNHDSEQTQVETQISIEDETTQVATQIDVSSSKNDDEEATQVEGMLNHTEKLPEKSVSEDKEGEGYLADSAILVNPELEKQAELLEQEVNEWMKDESLILATESLEKEIAEEKTATEQAESLSDVDDEEIDAMLLNPDEVKVKTTVWFNANKEYLDEMEAKARKLEMDRKNGIYPRKGKGQKKKRLPPASTPAEAAKNLVKAKKLSKKINQAVFDDMFESPESIARIKERDRKRQAMADELTDISNYEVVEESGETPQPKKPRTEDSAEVVGQEAVSKETAEEEEDEEEEMDLDDMADDERFLLEQRKKLGWDEEVTEDNYYDYD
ncbi:transcription factor TFIIIB subunit brf1 [Apophysomyces ossiformis]|uniref:B-related factor 1 n=1 Tax=Apophysomyces ossiformis TaxID=679940 RepID=A0A8H7EMI9_9FUNG|nr:transcription factor TFIIIB subunit brf1 [Apophysomyces ossiformis]